MEEEASFVSTSTVISHPEHILLPEYGQETAGLDTVETLISQQDGHVLRFCQETADLDRVETLISQQSEKDNIQIMQPTYDTEQIRTLISQQSNDEIQTSISPHGDDQISHDQESPRLLSRVESELSFFISEAEILEDDKRLEECKESLFRQQKYHDRWEADMENRKHVLSERVKKLNLFHKNRLGLYDDLKSYAFDMKRKLRNKTDQDKEFIKPAEQTEIS